MNFLRGESFYRTLDQRRESRRDWMERMLGVGLAGATFSQSLAWGTSTHSNHPASKFSAPGPFRGRVIAVEHSGSIINNAFQREPVRDMLRRGMTELTGAPTWQEAWQFFFQKGERVGIKLNPVSRPYVVSSPETIQEIVLGLEAAGIKRSDIVLYDRYKQEFDQTGFGKWVEGTRNSYAADYVDNVQQRMDGYDPDHWMDMQLTLPGFDFSNERARRSYVAKWATTEVDKIVNVCLLKHHQSAGITMALKNVSHGMVNNVNRSHSSAMLNACGAFIPTAYAIPVLRNKNVLHIGDAVKALYHGGPGLNPAKAKYVWEHKKMYFSTDPVAMDKIGWEELDKKRIAMGMEKLIYAKPDNDSRFERMQPEHVDIAGALGLGEHRRDKIDLRQIKLA